MPVLELRLELPGVSRRRIAELHADPLVLEQLTPPGNEVRVVERPAAIESGAVVVIEARVLGVPVRWVSRIEGWSEEGFVDVQVEGPFARWRHEHLFGDGVLLDRVDYEVPAAVLGGRLVDLLFVRGELRRMFAHRHRVTASLLLGPGR